MGGRYRNRVAGWDVVNEAIDDHNGQLRNTIWRGSIGSDYLDLAFRFAHEADPKAELYLNEYGIEGSGSKTDGILSFARGMLARGVPIHGIGMQAHFELDSKASDAPAQREIEDTMARIAELGLKVRGTLSLIPNSHPQLQLPLKTVSAEGFGLSGKTESLLGRLDRLELASFRLNDVIASFSLQGYGTAGKRNGVLGLQVLERFKVIFNYPEGRMILEETGHTNDPFLGDMIGFGLQPFRQSFVIKRVVPSSPASESGLQKGDVLVSVDGVAIESLTPTELKKALSGQQGSQVEICVRRPTNDLSLCRQLQRRRRI